MCSSGFLQGLIGSPTQCGLPVVVIVPLSLLAPGTHGHPSLSISTPHLPPHATHSRTGLARHHPWPFTQLAVQHLGMRLQSGCRGIVGTHGTIVDIHLGCKWIGKSRMTSLQPRYAFQWLFTQLVHDSSPYACNKRTEASYTIALPSCMHTWLHQGCPMPRRTGIQAHCGRSLDRGISYINHMYIQASITPGVQSMCDSTCHLCV